MGIVHLRALPNGSAFSLRQRHQDFFASNNEVDLPVPEADPHSHLVWVLLDAFAPLRSPGRQAAQGFARVLAPLALFPERFIRHPRNPPLVDVGRLQTFGAARYEKSRCER